MTTSPFDPSDAPTDSSAKRLVFFGPPTAPPLGEPLAPPTGAAAREPTWFDRTVDSAKDWFRRNSPAKEPSRWLAGVGSLLLLVAGLALTIAKWQAISPSVRLVGLVILHVIVVALAERFRAKLPDVARALAHLGAGLFAATGIQAVSAIGRAIGYAPEGGRWPLSCLVGGIAASLVLEFQRKRWSAGWMRAELVLAVGLAATGFAAFAHAPVGVGAALLGASAFAARRNPESVAFSMAGLCAPFIGVFTTDWGLGTATTLGLTGNTLGWAAPIAGGVASVTLWLAAGERRTADSSLGRALRVSAALGLAMNLLVGYNHSAIRFNAAAWAWIVWGALLAMGAYRRNPIKCALTSVTFPAAVAIQLASIHATRVTFATVFGSLALVGIGALIVGRRSAFVRTVSHAGIGGTTLALGFVSDNFEAPGDVRLLGVALLLGGVATGLRGRFAGRKDFELIGAGIGAFGLVAEVLSLPTEHAFDIWLPIAVALAAASEWFLRSKARIDARFPFATAATFAAFYGIAGQLSFDTGGRAAIAVALGLSMLCAGALKELNAVAVIGVATLLGSLGLALGPRLATMPVWGQFALGGLALFGLAAAIEKRRIAARAMAESKAGTSM